MNSVYLEDLFVGQDATRQYMADDVAIRAFADVSQDHNPVHVDDEYAAASPFRSRIAHGALLGAWISATIANELPGRGAIYVSQSLSFKRAVKLGDEVSITVTVTEIDLKTAHVTLSTVVRVRNKVHADGVADVIAPRRPA